MQLKKKKATSVKLELHFFLKEVIYTVEKKSLFEMGTEYILHASCFNN